MLWSPHLKVILHYRPPVPHRISRVKTYNPLQARRVWSTFSSQSPYLCIIERYISGTRSVCCVQGYLSRVKHAVSYISNWLFIYVQVYMIALRHDSEQVRLI